MRGLAGLVGLVLVLAVAGVVVKNRLNHLPANLTGSEAASTQSHGPGAERARQDDQVRRTVEKLMQQPRPLPEDPTSLQFQSTRLWFTISPAWRSFR